MRAGDAVSLLTIRPIGPNEVDLFTSFADATPLGLKPPLQAYLDGLGRWYRPEWSWVALRDGVVVARVAFSGAEDGDRPFAMGSLEIGTRPDRLATGVALVRAAYARYGRPRYHQFVPVDWHEHADMRAAVADRMEVARLAGLTFLAERLELRWNGTPLPPRPRRLDFRPVAAGDDLLGVVAGTVEATLDAGMRDDVARVGLDGAVRAFVAQLPGPMSLWRSAHDPAGRCVGLAVPGRGPWGPDIGYIGVLPAYRGHRYADDLLIEASRLLVEDGADEIDAMTDVGNTPMAAAFQRCGYATVDRMLVHV
jgi:ribosomal protein S18 acetylase RimI-like enzyme